MYFKDEIENKRYLKKNEIEEGEVGRYFNWSEEGDVLLNKNILRKSNKIIEDGSTCINWCMLNDQYTMILLKRPLGDIYRENSIEDYYIALYNNVLLPEISLQLRNSCAKYYLAKMDQKKDKTNYIITIDFKKPNEVLIHGSEILEKMSGDTSEKNIEKLIQVLKAYLTKKGFLDLDIKRVEQDFIKQTLFNRFIQQNDEHNNNWGIVIDERENSVRLAPSYDMDCSCEVKKPKKIHRQTNDGCSNLESILRQYQEKSWLQSYVKDILNEFNIEKAFEDTKKYTNKEIPNDLKGRYRRFFSERMQELGKAYHKVYEKEEKEMIR